MKKSYYRYFLKVIIPIIVLLVGAGSAVLTFYIFDLLGLLKPNFLTVTLFLLAGFLIFELILFVFKMIFGNLFVFTREEEIFTEKEMKTNIIVDKPVDKNISTNERTRLKRIINLKDD